MKIKFIFLILINLLFMHSCQLGYIIKKENLAQNIGQNKNLFLISNNNNKYFIKDIYENYAGVVLVFWQTGCPCVKYYQAEVNKLAKLYENNNIKFIHISSSSENFEYVIQEYNKRKIPVKLMRDPKANLAKVLKVRGTPTAVLINTHGDVKFMGWIDNRRNSREPGYKPYLKQALQEFMRNQPITTPVSPMFGCKIN